MCSHLGEDRRKAESLAGSGTVEERQSESATKDTKWQLITEVIILLFKMGEDTMNVNEVKNLS